MSSADELRKQFGPRSGLAFCWPDLDPSCLARKKFLKKLLFKNISDDKNHEKLASMQRVILLH